MTPRERRSAFKSAWGKMETLTAARALDLFEPRFWITSGLPTIRPEFDGRANGTYCKAN